MKKLSVFIIIGLFLAACSDFLEEYSQDQFHPTSATDLNEFLLGSGYWGKSLSFAELEGLSDDVREYRTTQFEMPPALYGFYTWQEFPYFDNEDKLWKEIYKSIGVANAIIAKIEDFAGDDLYNKVKGEAYYIRAAGYFLLANIYALPYTRETAANTLGVPVKLSNYVTGHDWHRTKLDTVYNTIVSDLLIAAKSLEGVEQPTIFRANEYAAHALLSRVYLYMENYERTIAECDAVLGSLKYRVTSLQGASADSCFTALARPEIIFSQGGYTSPVTGSASVGDYFVFNLSSYCMKPSKNLKEQYSPNDLRRNLFIKDINGRNEFCYKTAYDDAYAVSDFGMLRLSEVVLNKAEAQAMLGREGEAVKTLEDLLVGRYSRVPEITATGADLVEWIRDERRRELCFEGHRWFDLRRYAVNSKYPFTKEIVHVVDFYDNSGYVVVKEPREVYRLVPYDTDNRKWCLPIPGYETELTDMMVQNERYESEFENYEQEKHEQYE